MEPEGKKCHVGLVEHMSWEYAENPEDRKIMSSGHDGYVKWWKYLDIENVVLDDNSNGEITPLRSVLLTNPETKEPIMVVGLVKREGFWLVQDGKGYLIKVTPNDGNEFPCEIITSFNSGPIISAALVPDHPVIIAQGSDKKIDIASFASNMKSFPEKCLLEDPSGKDNLKPCACDIPKRDSLDDPFISAVGYDNGAFKIFSIDPNAKKLSLIYQSRPHEKNILKIKFSPDCSYLCTCTNKELFFFLVEKFDKIIPWCQIIIEDKWIVDIDWHIDSKKVLVGYNNGTLEEIEIPLQFDKTKTFILKEYQKKEFKIKQAENQIEKMDEKKRQRLKEAGKLKEEPEPGSVLSCKYINLYEEGDFLVTSQKPYAEFLYLCTFNFSETNTEFRPVNFWKLPDGEFYLKHISKDYIFLSSSIGEIQIRSKKLLDKYVEINPNLPRHQVMDIATSPDEKFICCAYDDGICSVYNLDTETYEDYIDAFTQGRMDAQEELNEKPYNPPELNKESINDIVGKMKKGDFNEVSEGDASTMLSLENDKQQAQEKEKERIADEKRQKLFTKINSIRADYTKLKEKNNTLPEEVRLTPDELIIDHKYLEIVQKEKQANLEDVENKFKWEKANVNVMISKIDEFFLSSIETNKVTVYCFRKNLNVSTLRCPSLPDKFEEKLLKYENDIKDFKKKIDFDSLLPKYLPLIDTNPYNEETERKKFVDLIEKAEQRLQSQESKKGAKQIEIEPEIEDTKGDVKAIHDLLDAKVELKRKIQEREDRMKNKKSRKYNNNKFILDDKIGRFGKCPEIYNLKMKYDRGYNEKTMLTTQRQKKKIYEYLKIVYNERQNFNNKIIDLKKKKLEILEKLKGYVKQITEYNNILGVEESYDWENFENKDNVQDLKKIPEDELNEYMLKRVEKDEEIKPIFQKEIEGNKDGENKDKKDDEEEEDELNFVVKERSNKQENKTTLQNEYTKLNENIYGYKKTQLLKEINSLIDDFDNELEELKNEKSFVSFYQKLGEYELLLKHKELNKLRAFDNEDKKFCDKLIKMFDEYTANLENLKRNYGYMEENKRELKKQEEKKREKELAFEK